jgi:hypothetical protein
MATSPAVHGLSPRAERALRVLSTGTVLILAVSAAILSFSGLQDLATTAGINPTIAWLLPVIIDGMVLTGSLGVIAAGMVGLSTWYPWTLTILGVILSVWGNVASAPNNLVAQIVHAIAPLTFALSIEGMLRIYRAGATATLQREQAAAAAEDLRIEREERRADRLAKAQAAALTVTPPQGLTTLSGAPAHAPATPVASATTGETARERINSYLETHPNDSAGAVARALGLDPSYTRKIVRAVREEGTSDTAQQQVSETGSDEGNEPLN